jgi:iron complex outermembrane recepter protein
MSDSSEFRGENLQIARAVKFALAAALLGAGGAANAQQAASSQAAGDGESIDEVVVTGFRASLNKALDAKQEQVGAIDMIVAEDIADFPDLNLAESLQRLPGVVIARDAGEGRQISVRGLGPQFARVRINGVEAMSANGGTDAAGGTNRGRSFDFNTFSSELFSNITVRKTAAAEVEEGSLGATVDLRTARPFDYPGFTLAGSAQLGYNDLNGDSDPRAAFLISDTFADGRFGALFSAAYTDRKLGDEGSSTVRWAAGGGFGPLETGNAGPPTLAQINAAYRPRIPRYDKYEHDQQRIGLTGALQFAPNETTKISLDALWSRFDAQRNEQFLEAPVFSTAGAANIGDVNVVSAAIDDSNSLVYGVFNDVDIRSEARHDELTTEFTQFTLEGKHDFNDAFSLSAMAGFAESNHDNPIQTTLLFDALNVDGYSYDYRDNSRLPLITYGNADVTDNRDRANGGIWQLSQIRLRPQSTINSFQTASFDLTWKAADAFSLKFGPQWKNYVFKSTEERRSNGTTANLETIIPPVAAPAVAPISTYSELTTFGSGLDLPAGTVRTWLIPDLNAAVAALHLDDPTIYAMGIQPALGNNYEIEEDDRGVYLQGDFSFPLGSHTLRGNVGVRYVETEQTSTGYTFSSGAPLRATVTRDYSDTLPSLNLVYDFSDKLLLRLGAAKTLTRPNLANLNPGSAVSVSGNARTVTAGNPDLEPFRADAYDLAFEWYFAPESLLSVALFYKDIHSFVQTIRDSRPFTDNPLGLPDSVAIAACGTTPGCSPDVNWDFNLPANTPGGPLKGFEVAYQQPFSFLPGVWSNFGTILNYTGVESEIDYLNAAGAVTATDDLTGLSKRSYNATLYFDNKIFSARVSAAYRSEYLTTVPGRDGNDVEGTAETLNIDFSTSYAINDHFTLSLEGLNLTDEVQDQWVDRAGDRLSYYHHQGRQFYLGARFKY